MHTDMTGVEAREAVETEAMQEPQARAPAISHNLMDVLMPANPPQPKNARVVRLFDYEAARCDAQPAPVQAHERTPRDEARAARKLSLLAAAGLS